MSETESAGESVQEATKALSGVSKFDAFMDMDISSPSVKSGALFNDAIKGDPDGLQQAEKGQEKANEVVKEASAVPEGEKKEVVSPSSPPPISNARVLKAKAGDKELELPEDAAFTIKVNGKDETVTLAQLQRNYQGRIPWDHHFKETKELEAKAKKFQADLEAEKSTLNGKIEDILETFDKNPYLAFEKIAIMKGKNPADYLPTYIAQSQKTLEELKGLTDAQLAASIKLKKAEYEARKNEERAAELDKKEKESLFKAEAVEADQYLVQKAAEYNITQAELDTAVNIIKEAGTDISKYKPKQLADMLVESIVKIDRPYLAIEKTIAEVSPSYEKKGELAQQLFKMVDHTTPIDEIKLIVEHFFKEEIPTDKGAAQTAPAKQVVQPPSPAKTQVPQKGEKPKATVVDDDDIGPLSMDDIVGWATRT